MKNLISKIMYAVILGSTLVGCRGKPHRHNSHSSSSSSSSSSSERSEREDRRDWDDRRDWEDRRGWRDRRDWEDAPDSREGPDWEDRRDWRDRRGWRDRRDWEDRGDWEDGRDWRDRRRVDLNYAFHNVPVLFTDAAKDIFRAYDNGRSIDFNAVITTTADAISAAITASHAGDEFTGTVSIAKATGVVTNTWNPGTYSALWNFSANELADFKAIAGVIQPSTIDGNLRGLHVINPTTQLAASGSPIVSVEDFRLSSKFVGSNARNTVGKVDTLLERIFVAILESTIQ